MPAWKATAVKRIDEVLVGRGESRRRYTVSVGVCRRLISIRAGTGERPGYRLNVPGAIRKTPSILKGFLQILRPLANYLYIGKDSCIQFSLN